MTQRKGLPFLVRQDQDDAEAVQAGFDLIEPPQVLLIQNKENGGKNISSFAAKPQGQIFQAIIDLHHLIQDQPAQGSLKPGHHSVAFTAVEDQPFFALS